MVKVMTLKKPSSIISALPVFTCDTEHTNTQSPLTAVKPEPALDAESPVNVMQRECQRRENRAVQKMFVLCGGLTPFLRFYTKET